MPFACPDCRRMELRIGLRIELPSDSRSDEIAVQIVECSGCGFRGGAIYEESRRGALNSESWEHSGYLMAKSDVDALAALIRQCREPADRRCRCKSHQMLGQKDSSGRWVGLKGPSVTAMSTGCCDGTWKL